MPIHIQRSILRTLGTLSLLVLALTSIADTSTEVLSVFDPATEGLPESVTTDYRGNVYISMGPANSVRKHDSYGNLLQTYALPVSPANFSTGVLVNWRKDIYVNVASFTADPATAGIWRIDQNGEASKFADLDPTGFPNGIISDYDDNIYVSDGVLGRIYKVNDEGNVSIWLTDPVLENISFVGVNGIVLSPSERFLYAANTDKGTISRIRIKRDGSAGNIKEIANDPALQGVDGITLNRRGNKLYAAINLQNSIAKVNLRNGKVKTIIAEDGNLDGPADVSFGKGRKRHSLYIANAALFSEEKFPALLLLNNKRHKKH